MSERGGTRGRRALRSARLGLVAACLMGATPADAQNPGFFIGVKGGLNVSTLSIDDPENRDLQIER